MESHNLRRVAVLLAFPVAFIGCSSDETAQDICEGRSLQPDRPSIVLGEMTPSSGADDALLNATTTPYEWNLLLHSPCDEPVTIEEVCLIDDGDGAADHFVLEGPEGDVASRGADSIVRLTYERSDTHDDGDQDDIAVVVQSDADDAPTLVVPVCARVVDDRSDDDEVSMSCSSPVTIPGDGESVSGLCS